MIEQLISIEEQIVLTPVQSVEKPGQFANVYEQVRNYRGFDLETPLSSPGNGAPEIICGSAAEVTPDGNLVGKLLTPQESLDIVKEYLTSGYTLATAQGSYDLAIVAHQNPELLPLIFKCLEEGRHHDDLISESLEAIFNGTLGQMPNGADLKNAEGKTSKRFSLYNVTGINLDRWDAKVNDVWRKSYYLLKGIPHHRWPQAAKVYPVDDAINQLEVALVQRLGKPNEHDWIYIPGIPGTDIKDSTRCRYCSDELTVKASTLCSKAPRNAPHRNQGNLAAQCQAAFAAHLGACHGLRTDGARVEKLAAEVAEKAKIATARFQLKGWIRPDESEDQCAVKRAIATAYGASGTCKRCQGTGKVRNPVEVECRGEKIKGRYKGCQGVACACGGTGKLTQLGNEVTCKNIFDKEALAAGTSPKDCLLQAGCDGTGIDLSSATILPRTDKLGVGTDRDAKTESGDEDLADYGEDEFQKSATTYIPYLRKGVHAPLTFTPNVLVATGRFSYEGSPMHQMPRNGGERGCIRARGAWCDYPIEMILGSTDYEAGELVTLAQLNYWNFGYSQMREAINASGKPGILHSDLAAEVLGISLEEFLVRHKAKDKTASDFRQAVKCINFGKGGAMGDAKLVFSARKKNTGFTVCERGPAMNEKKEPGYWGIRFCILTGGAKQCGIEKIMSWNDRDCPPICKACVEIVNGMLSPAYFRRYPEVKDYHKLVKKQIKSGVPAATLVWDADIGKPIIIRERGGLGEKDLPAYANNGFQSILSDVLKRALVTMTKECYLGVKADGSPSPLAGCRIPLVVHDEPVSELIRALAHLSGPRIGDIMEEAGRALVPDVAWVAKTALAVWWAKGMESVYDTDGNLTVWEPKQK